MGTTMQSGTTLDDYPERDPVCRFLSRKRGILPSSASQLLKKGLNYLVAEIIEAFNQARTWERREKWLAPIRAALENVAWEPMSRELRMKAERADTEEEMAQLAYLEDPSPLNRDRLIRAKLDQHLTSLAEAMALTNEKRQEVA